MTSAMANMFTPLMRMVIKAKEKAETMLEPGPKRILR